MHCDPPHHRLSVTGQPLARSWAPRAGLVAAFLFTAASAGVADHPRLLVSGDDVARIRHVAGLGTPASDVPVAWGRFGSRAVDFQALRAGFGPRMHSELLPGELSAAAFLRLIDPQPAQDDVRLAMVRAALERTGGPADDLLEAVLALDWCWAHLEASTRRDFLLTVRKRASPLTAADSPLDGRRFREKLTALALAVAVDEEDEPSPSWVTLRQHLLDAARTYFETTFPTYVTWRGPSPTGPAVAAREEWDTVLAIELAGYVLKREVWPAYGETVGRWLEHYLVATPDDPRLAIHFVRDDAGDAPLLPAPPWRELQPLTAHLLAVRTGDPSAATVADRVENAMRAELGGPSAALWRWVPLLFDTRDLPRCDLHRLPTARHLGGAVVFRGGAGPDMTGVWIDAGQPFLRRRQHFDAGHFLIRRGGELVVSGGDDIVLEAVPAKDGGQYLGALRTPFDFEQYSTASIAHNTVVLYDPVRVARWYGERYVPVGGQRCSEGTCTDFVTPLERQGRTTGRQLAYGQCESAAYLALDLTPAYDSRVLNRYTRQYVFFWGRALVVVDRLTMSRGRSLPTWILNLPSRPSVDGVELSPAQRVAGTTNQAGVWRCDDARWLHWSDRDGMVWFAAPQPTPRCLRAVGGPAHRLTIPRGRHAGQTYVGGDPDGFERLVIPAERRGAENAWYRLGEPTLLGEAVSRTPHWGRLEIEPTERAATTAFVTVLITDRVDAQEPPAVEVSMEESGLVLSLRSGADRAELQLAHDVSAGGRLEVPGIAGVKWTLPTKVEPDAPLPTARESVNGRAAPD